MAGLCRLRVAAPQPPTLRCLGLLLARSRDYGSAAAAQLHYDFDDYYEEEEMVHRNRREPKQGVDAVGSPPGRGVQWVVMGEPGAKKHVYAERLSKLLEVPHISMGTLVRQELNPCSSLYKQIATAVNEGKLVPEDVIFALLSKRLEEGYYRGETGFILDGIPRTRIQAEILDQIADIDLVVNFKCTEEHFLRNNIGNETLPPHREFLSMGNNVSSTADAGKPLEDYYRKQKKLLNFQVADAPGETWQGLLAALHLQHMNAVSSSQKLTA